MGNPEIITHAPHVVHHVAAVKHIVNHAANAAVIKHGVSMFTTIISSFITGVIAGVIGFFIGKRGLVGTQKDLNNAKTEVSKVSSEVTNAVQTIHA